MTLEYRKQKQDALTDTLVTEVGEKDLKSLSRWVK